MNVNTKSSKETHRDAAAENAEAPDFTINNVAGLLQKGVERMAMLQKTTLDMVNQQNADMSEAMKQAFHAAPAMPGLFLFDLGLQSMDKWVQAQKGMVDLLVEQSANTVDLVKQRAAYMSKAAEGLNEFVREAADRTVGVHRIALDYAAAQNKNVGEALGRQAGITGTPLAAVTEAIQRNVGSVIETQKETLEAAARPLKTSKA